MTKFFNLLDKIDHEANLKKFYKKDFVKKNPLKHFTSRIKHRQKHWMRRRQLMEEYVQNRWSKSLYNIERWKKMKSSMPPIGGQTMTLKRYNPKKEDN